LPVVDRIARDYLDEVRFIAVAGNNTSEAAGRQRAQELFHFLDWGIDHSIWELYNVPYQPYTVLITGDDVVLTEWFGAVSEEQIRAELDRLVATIGA